jgi:hypothetical protein
LREAPWPPTQPKGAEREPARAGALAVEKIASGEQNPTSAYMTGKLKVKGDMGAAMKLQKLF